MFHKSVTLMSRFTIVSLVKTIATIKSTLENNRKIHIAPITMKNVNFPKQNEINLAESNIYSSKKRQKEVWQK